MTDAGWAEKVARKRIPYFSVYTTEEVYGMIAKLLKAEHARAIRLVKAEMKRVKKDQHVFTAQTKGYLLEMLNHLLTALQRGRGGKG